MNTPERMTALCRTVPYLATREGFGEGWNPDLAFCVDDVSDDHTGEYPFPRWARSSSAAIEAVRFARHVWSADNPAPSLAFWDRAHREAFIAWASDPWWG